MTPERYVQEKAAASGSSFYYAFLFLPPDRRAAITAFYAFCREVDDVVDEMRDPSVAATKLAWWRQEVKAAFDGQPTHPATKALAPLAPRYGITPVHLQSVIDGCQMDLEQTPPRLRVLGALLPPRRRRGGRGGRKHLRPHA
jgi:phytoene synthase